MKPLSNESKMSLAQSLNIPTETGKDGQVSLVQGAPKKGAKHIVNVPMENLQNMGYEGQFFFGKPPQELQVIFDTGSAWAWVFSETCGDNNKLCPAR